MSFPTKSFLLVPFALASLALVACGGSGSNPNASGTKTGDEQQTLNFTRCMREHGVNISTPNGAGGPINVTGTSPQVMEAAQKACSRYRPQGGPEKLSPAERAAREDAVQSFARCMRSHGVEVQAQTHGGAVRIGVHLSNAKENPAFQAAQKACESYLPKPPGGRAGGPKPGSGGGPSTESSGQTSAPGGGSSLGLNAGK